MPGEKRPAGDATDADDAVARPPSRRRRAKSSVLWGVVGALAFLVLVGGWQLTGGEPIDLPVAAGVALLVGAAATGLAYLLEGRLTGRRAAGGNERG